MQLVRVVAARLQLTDDILDALQMVAMRDEQCIRRVDDDEVFDADRRDQAVAGVDAVYTDVWASMGEENEADARKVVFADYQVNRPLMAAASPAALFMHCLPAHRGEEVTSDVFDSTVSVVFDQAENRLHTQKALLLMLLS